MQRSSKGWVFLTGCFEAGGPTACPAGLLGCLGVAHIIPGGCVAPMQLIVQLNGPISTDQLGNRHMAEDLVRLVILSHRYGC